MFGWIARALIGPPWKGGFHPMFSRVLDVERAGASEPASNAPSRGGSYREPAAANAPSSGTRGPITALTYTVALHSIGDDSDRSEWHVRRIEPSADGRGVLAWQYAITEKAFIDLWIGRVGNAIVGCDGDGRFHALDVKSGAGRWRHSEKLASAPLRLPDGNVRALLEGDAWMDVDPADGRIVNRGAWRTDAERDAVVKDLVPISGGERWRYGPIETPRGLLRGGDPQLQVDREVRDGKRARTESVPIDFSPWRAWSSFVRCGDVIVVWVYRADSDRRRNAALVLLDVETLERVGWIDLGQGSDSLSPNQMSVCGSYVLVSSELGRDTEGDAVDVAKLIDIPTRRIVADLYSSSNKSHFYGIDGSSVVSVAI